MSDSSYTNDANQAGGGADVQKGGRTTHLRDYGIILLNRWPIIALALVVGLGLTWFVTQRQVRLYRTTAMIRLTPPNRGVSRLDDPFATSIVQDPVELNTLLELVQMSQTVEDAIRNANLEAQPDFDGMTNEEIVRHARGRITASQRRGRYLVDVSATGPNPKILDDLANAVVTEFERSQKDQADTARKQMRTEIKQRQSVAERNIQIAEMDKRSLLKDAGFTEPAFDDYLSGLLSERDSLGASKSAISLRQMDQRASCIVFKAAISAGDYASVRQNARVRDNADVKFLRERIERAETTLYQLTQVRGLGAKVFEVETANHELEKARKEREATERAIVDDFVASYADDESKLVDIAARLKATDTAVTEANDIKYRLDELNSDKARAERERDELKDDLAALGPEEPLITGSVSIVRRAREPNPSRPVSPNVPLNYTLGTILSLLVGVGVGFLIEYLDDTIRTKDELAKVTEVPLLGVVPYIKGSRADAASRDLVAYRYPKDTVAEAYRGIRTSLTLSARGAQHRVLLFTSAGPREGKTTTVINVATVFSYSGARTVVVDADLRKPRVHASFGLENIEGLSNALAQGVDPVPLCQQTEVPGVDILTSGPIPPNPSELLGSPRMRGLLERLCEEYDHVLLDTPPIGAVTDAAVLGTLVDGVILVVHAGKTRRGVVSRGLEQLRYIHAPVEGVILNNLRTGRRGYYAGYYNYYYYYSYYGSPSARDTSGEEASGRAMHPAEPPQSATPAKD